MESKLISLSLQKLHQQASVSNPPLTERHPSSLKHFDLPAQLLYHPLHKQISLKLDNQPLSLEHQDAFYSTLLQDQIFEPVLQKLQLQDQIDQEITKDVELDHSDLGEYLANLINEKGDFVDENGILPKEFYSLSLENPEIENMCPSLSVYNYVEEIQFSLQSGLPVSIEQKEVREDDQRLQFVRQEEVYAKGEAAGQIATPGGLKLSQKKDKEIQEINLKWLQEVPKLESAEESKEMLNFEEFKALIAEVGTTKPTQISKEEEKEESRLQIDKMLQEYNKQETEEKKGLEEEEKQTSISGISLSGENASLQVFHIQNQNEELQRLRAKDDASWAQIDKQPVVNFRKLIPELALEFPFELDDFQKRAIMRLEKGENVLVAAHTSAGKTVIADYAIGLAMKHMQKAIYTSPIKALSNQKYRDFKAKFEDVGIFTGDVSVNREARCLIVTTEVLQSMLYRGAEITRDLEWVIFDEVHYINDLERGFVWEEIIIMLPDNVGIVMLSATVPNFLHFASWVGTTKRKKVFVQLTTFRPTPLEHYLYLDGSLVLLKSKDQKFIETNYSALLARREKKIIPQKKKEAPKQVDDEEEKKIDYRAKAIKAKKQALQKTALRGKRGGGGGQKTNDPKHKRLGEAISFLKSKALLPVVVFVFSKKEIMRRASALTVQLTTSGQKARVLRFFRKCLKKFKEADRYLPQLELIRQMVIRGIGVHHAGLLPIVKEMVEILFAEGLIKVLFATTTFAMGVNMPARSVMFLNLRRFDGEQLRVLQPSQYLQMAGRAGRRGVDQKGTVIVYCDQIQSLISMGEMRQVMQNAGEQLESKFRLTYKMMLFVLKSQVFQVEDMMKYSFSQFKNRSKDKHNVTTLARLKDQANSLPDIECIHNQPSLIQDFALLHLANKKIAAQVVKAALTKSIKEKRVVCIWNADYFFVRAVIVAEASQEKLLVLLAPQEPCSTPIQSGFTTTESLYYEYAKVDYGDVFTIFAKGLQSNWQCDLKSGQIQSRHVDSVVEQLSSLPPKLPEANLKNEFKIQPALVKEYKAQKLNFEGSKCKGCKLQKEHFQNEMKRRQVRHQMQKVAHLLSNKNIGTMKQFEKRLRVLLELGYIESDSLRESLKYKDSRLAQQMPSHSNDIILQLKGKIAREISSLDQLLCTELLVSNSFRSLSGPECLVVLSLLMKSERSSDHKTIDDLLDWSIGISDSLTHTINATIKVATRVTDAEREVELQDEAIALEQRLNLNVYSIVHEWALGKDFVEICKITQLDQGSIVKSILRLENACRDVRNAARVMGNAAVGALVEEARQLIRRDIIFAPSLYIH